MRRTPQPQLFVLTRDLTDAERTILEAIDTRGTVTVKDAGRIVYRLRGYTVAFAIPPERVLSEGRRVLKQLDRAGLVKRRGCVWVRARKDVV